jgi:putative ABC transport system permease protein
MNSFNFRSYFNFLSRNKGYTAINLVGFSAALMFVILLGLYIHKESQVDRFHAKADRIYRLDRDAGTGFTWPIPLGPDLMNRYPEIESFTRLSHDMATVGRPGEEKSRAQIFAVDSTFFSIFSFPILAGDPTGQLRTTNEVTLTRSFATRLFGNTDPVGQPIEISGKRYTVSGVAADFENSHFDNPDLLVRIEYVGSRHFGENAYRNASFPLYIATRPNTDLPAREQEIADWFHTFLWLYQDGYVKEVVLEPLAESYYNPVNSLYLPEVYRGNNKRTIGFLGIAALVLLLFAVINYVNLSVAQTGFRAKEAATRRLLGGTRGGLFMGYILESVFFCAVAFAIALLLAGLAEPLFNRTMQRDISIVGVMTPGFIAGCVGFVVVLGLISGFFPALIVSRYKPINVVRGEFTRKTRMIYSRLFIGLQFCLTIVLLGCAITVGWQTRFLRNAPLGFDSEQLIYLENRTSKSRLPGLRDRLMQIPGVKMVSFTTGDPIDAGNNRTSRNEDGTTVSFQLFESDSLFFPILGIEKVYETGIRADSAVWINQTAARLLNLAPDADRFQLEGQPPITLAGIVKDFHIRRLEMEIGPVMIERLEEPGGGFKTSPWSILVKIDSPDPGETYRQVQSAYLDYNGGEPSESGFVDATIDGWYDEQERTGAMIAYFSVLAILISAMGLLAMATYFMRQRARDIAVRKVFGAANGEVLNRLVFSFLKIVGVSFVIAVPVIWYAMSRWLQTFAYHIPLSWTIFAMAGILAAAIAFTAVFWQSWRAANANPVKTLYKG